MPVLLAPTVPPTGISGGGKGAVEKQAKSFRVSGKKLHGVLTPVHAAHKHMFASGTDLRIAISEHGLYFGQDVLAHVACFHHGELLALGACLHTYTSEECQHKACTIGRSWPQLLPSLPCSVVHATQLKRRKRQRQYHLSPLPRPRHAEAHFGGKKNNAGRELTVANSVKPRNYVKSPSGLRHASWLHEHARKAVKSNGKHGGATRCLA